MRRTTTCKTLVVMLVSSMLCNHVTESGWLKLGDKGLKKLGGTAGIKTKGARIGGLFIDQFVRNKTSVQTTPTHITELGVKEDPTMDELPTPPVFPVIIETKKIRKRRQKISRKMFARWRNIFTGNRNLEYMTHDELKRSSVGAPIVFRDLIIVLPKIDNERWVNANDPVNLPLSGYYKSGSGALKIHYPYNDTGDSTVQLTSGTRIIQNTWNVTRFFMFVPIDCSLTSTPTIVGQRSYNETGFGEDDYGRPSVEPTGESLLEMTCAGVEEIQAYGFDQPIKVCEMSPNTNAFAEHVIETDWFGGIREEFGYTKVYSASIGGPDYLLGCRGAQRVVDTQMCDNAVDLIQQASNAEIGLNGQCRVELAPDVPDPDRPGNMIPPPAVQSEDLPAFPEIPTEEDSYYVLPEKYQDFNLFVQSPLLASTEVIVRDSVTQAALTGKDPYTKNVDFWDTDWYNDEEPPIPDRVPYLVQPLIKAIDNLFPAEFRRFINADKKILVQPKDLECQKHTDPNDIYPKFGSSQFKGLTWPARARSQIPWYTKMVTPSLGDDIPYLFGNHTDDADSYFARHTDFNWLDSLDYQEVGTPQFMGQNNEWTQNQFNEAINYETSTNFPNEDYINQIRLSKEPTFNEDPHGTNFWAKIGFVPQTSSAYSCPTNKNLYFPGSTDNGSQRPVQSSAHVPLCQESYGQQAVRTNVIGSRTRGPSNTDKDLQATVNTNSEGNTGYRDAVGGSVYCYKWIEGQRGGDNSDLVRSIDCDDTTVPPDEMICSKYKATREVNTPNVFYPEELDGKFLLGYNTSITMDDPDMTNFLVVQGMVPCGHLITKRTVSQDETKQNAAMELLDEQVIKQNAVPFAPNVNFPTKVSLSPSCNCKNTDYFGSKMAPDFLRGLGIMPQTNWADIHGHPYQPEVGPPEKTVGDLNRRTMAGCNGDWSATISTPAIPINVFCCPKNFHPEIIDIPDPKQPDEDISTRVCVAVAEEETRTMSCAAVSRSGTNETGYRYEIYSPDPQRPSVILDTINQYDGNSEDGTPIGNLKGLEDRLRNLGFQVTCGSDRSSTMPVLDRYDGFSWKPYGAVIPAQEPSRYAGLGVDSSLGPVFDVHADDDFMLRANTKARIPDHDSSISFLVDEPEERSLVRYNPLKSDAVAKYTRLTKLPPTRAQVMKNHDRSWGSFIRERPARMEKLASQLNLSPQMFTTHEIYLICRSGVLGRRHGPLCARKKMERMLIDEGRVGITEKSAAYEELDISLAPIKGSTLQDILKRARDPIAGLDDIEYGFKMVSHDINDI